MPLKDFGGKTVLVSGHTGFKGSWLTAWLLELGARVVGVSLEPVTNPSHFVVANLGAQIDDRRLDVRDLGAVRSAVEDIKPDFVFHLAAQALVRLSYADPVATHSTNIIGTLHVLEALRSMDKSCAAVLVTSDKVYLNQEWTWGYRETDPLGGYDPYSASKGAAELVIRSHVRSFFDKETSPVRIGVARAGNVIGGGDWASDRIVPDCARAWSNGQSVELRNPRGTRPWQHVLEALSGYLALALALASRPEIHGEAFNFGPPADQNQSVRALVEEMGKHWPAASWRDASEPAAQMREAGLLKLNCDKALHRLSWRPVLDFEGTVRMTAEWYRQFYSRSEQAAALSRRQVAEYGELARARGLEWAQ